MFSHCPYHVSLELDYLPILYYTVWKFNNDHRKKNYAYFLVIITFLKYKIINMAYPIMPLVQY